MRRIIQFMMMLVAMAVTVSCGNDLEEVIQPSGPGDFQFVIGGFPQFESDTRAVGTPDVGKTAWEDGDRLLLSMTCENGQKQGYTLEYLSGEWTHDKVLASSDIAGILVLYAPDCEIKSDGSIGLADGKLYGMAEYIPAETNIDGFTVNISFDGVSRDYSRLRIVGEPDKALTVDVTGFIPAGPEESSAFTRYTVTPDAKGNAYLYGTFSVGATLSVKLGEVTVKDYAFTAEKHPDGTEHNKSYALDAAPPYHTFTASANAWSNFAIFDAYISSKTGAVKESGLTIQWKKKGDDVWTEMSSQSLNVSVSNDIKATLKGLTPDTDYEYRLRYEDGGIESISEPVAFTTEEQVSLYNGGFEDWWVDGNVEYPNEQDVNFWDTKNKSSASFGGSNTTGITNFPHGGNKAARLESKYVVIKFSAASLFTGSFVRLIDTDGDEVNWGTLFASRPTALKGWMQYAPAYIAGTQGYNSDAPADAPGIGEPDVCAIFCALLSEALTVYNKDMSTFPDWETDPRVIAYGALPAEQSVNTNGQWKEVNIPLVYRDLNKKPTHLLIVFTSSKYGDYQHGGKGSLLYIDDFSLEYGDTPACQ